MHVIDFHKCTSQMTAEWGCGVGHNSRRRTEYIWDLGDLELLYLEHGAGLSILHLYIHDTSERFARASAG